MIRQSLVIVSALTVIFAAGLLTGCEKQAEESAPASSATAASEADQAQDEVAEGADESAKAHDMDMEGDNGHDMDMQAGEDLHGDFAHKELVVLDDPVEVPAEFTEALGQMHQHYRDMAQAFVADDAEAADAAAQQMREQVEGLSADGLDAEAKDAWESHRKGLRTGLHQLTSAGDVEGKREHFSHISEAMYCALKSFHHADLGWQIYGGARQGTHQRGHPRVDGPAAEDRTGGSGRRRDRTAAG